MDRRTTAGSVTSARWVRRRAGSRPSTRAPRSRRSPTSRQAPSGTARTGCPPTAYRMLVLEDLTRYRTSLRWCVGAGEPLNPDVIETWHRGTGHLIRDGYGQTETVLLCGNYPSLEVRPGSMGKPSPGMPVAVMDDDGQVLGPDNEGDIAVRYRPARPVGLFQEDWKDAVATEAIRHRHWYVKRGRTYVNVGVNAS